MRKEEMEKFLIVNPGQTFCSKVQSADNQEIVTLIAYTGKLSRDT